MAKKALKKTAKVLGGLGAAYMLADQLGPRVEADPVEAARDVLATHERLQRERVDRPPAPTPEAPPLTSRVVYKKGGAVSASRRADGIAQRGKTRGKMY
jgi:hypothetical protein